MSRYTNLGLGLVSGVKDIYTVCSWGQGGPLRPPQYLPARSPVFAGNWASVRACCPLQAMQPCLLREPVLGAAFLRWPQPQHGWTRTHTLSSSSLLAQPFPQAASHTHRRPPCSGNLAFSKLGIFYRQ